MARVKQRWTSCMKALMGFAALLPFAATKKDPSVKALESFMKALEKHPMRNPDLI